MFMPPCVRASIELQAGADVALRARTGDNSSSRESLDSSCSAASLVDARRSASFSSQRSWCPSAAAYGAGIAASSSLFAPAVLAGLVQQASPFAAVVPQQQQSQPAPMAYAAARAQPAALMQPSGVLASPQYCDRALGADGRLSSPYGMAAAGPSPCWSTTSELECELLAQMQHLPAGSMPSHAASSAAAAAWTGLGGPMVSTAMAHAPSTALTGLQDHPFYSAPCCAAAPGEATLDMLLAAAAAAAGAAQAPLLLHQQQQQQMMMLVDTPATRARRASYMPESDACWPPASMPAQEQRSWPLPSIDVAAAAAADDRALAALDGQIAAKIQQLMVLRQDAVARKAALLGQAGGCGFGDGLPVCSSIIMGEASLAGFVGASGLSPASPAMVQAAQFQGPSSPSFSALLPGGGTPLQHLMLLGQL